MRTIKFRAWDKTAEEMTLSNEIFEVLISMDNKVFAMVKNNDNSIGEIDRSNTVIMQYTGLKDKNGKEIYEGDILKGKNSWIHGNDAVFGEVYYSNRGTWDCESFLLGALNETCEVVGNIYEHKHLLKEKN